MLVPQDHPQAKRVESLALAPPGEERSRGLTEVCQEMLVSDYGSTWVHESHHFLQLLTFPFQYLQALRELLTVTGLLSALHGPYRDEVLTLDASPLPPEYSWTYFAPVRAWGLAYGDNELRVIGPATDADVPVQLSPSSVSEAALLEESTSIFEFQASHGEPGTGSAYRAWLSAGPSRYSAVFRWLARLWGTEEAYAALPALVRAAFHTTEPCVAFALLLKARVAPARELGSEAYYVRALDLLADLLPTLREGTNYPAYTEPRPAPSDRPLFIRESDLDRWIAVEPRQLVAVLAGIYRRGLAQGHFLTSDLFRPFESEVLGRLGRLSPLMLVMSLRHPAVLPRDTVGAVNPLVADLELPPEHVWSKLGGKDRPITYGDAVVQLQRMRAVGLALARVPLTIGHNCHHTECPLHKAGVCRWWTAIPRQWTECAFPAWFALETNHIVTTMGDLAPRKFYSTLPSEWPDGWKRFSRFTQRDWLTKGPSVKTGPGEAKWPVPGERP
jgi:hypothetical protein